VYVPTKIIVTGNAAATAANIITSESLFRLGILSNVIGSVLFIFLALLLYRLFEGVSKILARQLVALVIVSVSISFVNEIIQLGALIVLKGDDYLKVFEQDKLYALSMLFIKLHGRGIVINEVFWGLWLFPFGLLAIKSGFIPRVIGILLFVAGSAYVIDSFVSLIIPPYRFNILDTILMIMEIGEIPIIFWLLIKGVKAP
jgi:hypothetical protein